MPNIRVPAAQIPQFKFFCKQFAVHFEKTTGVRLRGNKLLNLVAHAAGHGSYTALLIDAGTYGDGDLTWESIPNLLSNPIAVMTGVSHELCLHALTMSLREVRQTLATVNSVRILNEPAIYCIDASGLETSAIEKIIREQNPSIKSSLASFSPIQSDISQLGGASEEELSTIFSNIRINIPFSETENSFGEIFAERKRPMALMQTEQQLIEAIEIAKTSLSPSMRAQNGSYDLNQLSNYVYQLLPTTNGFSSLDVAGWILDHGRKFGVSVRYL